MHRCLAFLSEEKIQSAEALYYLEKAGFRTAISRAVWATYQRSLELGKEKRGHIDTHEEES
jgi:hypothetical protein